MVQIRRGTAPTFNMRIPLDLSTITLMRCSFSQEDVLISKDYDQKTPDAGNLKFDLENKLITCELTQEETLLFSEGIVLLQCKGQLEAGGIFATTLTKFYVDKILDKDYLYSEVKVNELK